MALSETRLAAIGAVRDDEDARPFQHGVAAARAQLGAEAFAAAWAAGQTLSLDAAIALALAEGSALPPDAAPLADSSGSA